MGISMECLLEIIDDFTHGAAGESTVRNTTTWGIFKACMVSLKLFSFALK